MNRLRDFCRDKIWIVTGASSGIGLAMVRDIAKHHGMVWALDIDVDRLASLEQESRREGWDVFIHKADVTDLGEMRAAIAKIKSDAGRIDVWVNNAGIQVVGSFCEQSESDFDRVMNVNLTSVIRISRDVVKLMEQQGGGILVNMASTTGHIPAPFMAAYVTAKHGVVGFTKALQAEFELLKSPVRAVFASPGFVKTDIIKLGEKVGFPDWLSWMLSEPSSCSREILVAMMRGSNEIHPTMSGRVMRTAYNLMPATTVKSSKLLLTKGLKDFFLNRYQVPR